MENAASKKERINRISMPSNILINVIFILILFLFLVPLLLIVIVSFTPQQLIDTNGYSFFPQRLCVDAYKFIFQYGSDMARAYGNSILVTALGSVGATFVIALFAYPLSRSSFRHRNKFAFFAFFTTIFGGGLVPWVMLYSSLGLSNTIWILIIPYLMNPWWVIIMRTFMKSSVPDELIEAAKIDGSGEGRIFFQIVIPLSKAGLATIFLFCLLRYWNDYYLSLIFISNDHLYTIQYYMYNMLNNISELMMNSNIPSDARANLPGDSARMALAVFAVGPVVITYPFFQRYFAKGLTIGAVKG
jgi:putative aldouronate transport system permease protein